MFDSSGVDPTVSAYWSGDSPPSSAPIVGQSAGDKVGPLLHKERALLQSVGMGYSGQRS